MNKLEAWVKRHCISEEALNDLEAIIGISHEVKNVIKEGYDERNVQAEVRLESGQKGYKLWRNNVGVLEDKRGVPIRYGLANDSKQLNSQIKSSDLIGWKQILITQDMVGTHIAQFVARECKHPGWKWSGTDREIAQAAWIYLILMDGGDASFCTGVGTL